MARKRSWLDPDRSTILSSAYPTSTLWSSVPILTRSSTASLSIGAPQPCLSRGEYIFDLEKAVVVETPQLAMPTKFLPTPEAWKASSPSTPGSTKEDRQSNKV